MRYQRLNERPPSRCSRTWKPRILKVDMRRPASSEPCVSNKLGALSILRVAAVVNNLDVLGDSDAQGETRLVDGHDEGA